jgi:hypothetical protein
MIKRIVVYWWYGDQRTVLLTCRDCHLGGVMVSVLAIRPKVGGFKPGRGDGFLRVITIRSTPSFRGEVTL